MTRHPVRPPARPRHTAEAVAFGAARALAADLRDLGVDLEAGSYTSTTLAMFRRDLLRAVPSALGGTVRVETLEGHGSPVEIHLVDRTLHPHDIAAGLLLSLDQVREGLVGSVLLYAGQPGAFHDLAADLRATAGAESHQVDEHPPLPRQPVSPSVDGLQNFSLVNRALGVLIGRGYSLVQARTELADRAEQASTDLSHAAQRLLSTYR